MATFQEITPIEIEFLKAIAPIFSNAIHTAMQSKQIRSLLRSEQEKSEALSAQAEELHSQSEELRQTSDELQEQNVELTIQRRQVEEANRLKGEFLSSMSHELRTPLNSVMALSRVLMTQAGEKLSQEEMSYIAVISRNGEKLLLLINEILDLSKKELRRNNEKNTRYRR